MHSNAMPSGDPVEVNGQADGIPEATVARLPVYLRALYGLAERGISTVASEELAAAAGVNSAKLRKDLSHLGSYGIRGVGYDVDYLVYQVSRTLGLTQDWPVVIVGAGNLGRALANYGGFVSRGFTIAAMLDCDTAIVGSRIARLTVRHVDELEALVARHKVAIGVIATPAGSAQAVCDRLVSAGVTSILNFAPLVLSVPEGVDVRKVDLSIELQILAFHAQRRSAARPADAAEHGNPGDPPRSFNASGDPGTGGQGLGGGFVSVLVVGLSHKSAPVAVLERAAVSGDTLSKLLRDVVQAEPVAEAFVVSTCNRVEVYADVDRFHAGVTAICELLARHCGVPSHELTQYLYVHYEDRAVSHLLAVAAGLDSMVVGEDQILGQVRSAVKLAAEHGTAGRVLGELGRLALRTGKRARAETAIGRAGLSLLSAAVELAAARLGPPARPRPGGRAGRRHSRRAGCRPAGRPRRAHRRGRLDERAGHGDRRPVRRGQHHRGQPDPRARRTAGREREPGHDHGHRAGGPARRHRRRGRRHLLHRRGRAGHHGRHGVRRAGGQEGQGSRRVAKAAGGALVIMDLAMPRDVEPAVAGLPGVVLIGMDQLSEHASAVRDDDVAAVRAILEAELAAYQSAMDAARVAPTVVALRAKAAGVVDAELARLAGRLSADALSGHALDEIAQTVRRVVDKLLHAPTVRVKELAGSPGGEEYAAALRVLFDLDPRAVEAVTRAAPEQEGSR